MNKTTGMHFNDLEWHDAVIKKIEVDRSEPGTVDTITMELVWPDGKNSLVIFEKVQWANLDVNFNFSGPDYVAEATILENIDNAVAAYLMKRRNELDYKVNFYAIRSSISDIKILARSFRMTI